MKKYILLILCIFVIVAMGINEYVNAEFGSGAFGTGGTKIDTNQVNAANRIYYLDSADGSPTPALITDNEGNVGIGAVPGVNMRLHVESNVTGYHVIFKNTAGATADGIRIQAGDDVNPGVGVHYIRFDDGDVTEIGAITGDGVGGVNYASVSDKRLKKNIRNTHYKLKDLLKIKVRDFEMIRGNVTSTGYVAQELYTVYPVAVSNQTDENKMWGVDYGKTTPLIVISIQELKKEKDKEIAELKKEIEALKQRITKGGL